MDSSGAAQKIERFISSQVEAAGTRGVVLGLSGGIDSAVVAALCVRALGKERVLLLSMPSEGQQDNAVALAFAKQLGAECRVIGIDEIRKAFAQKLPSFGKHHLSTANLAPRIRMAVLYYHANLLSRLVCGTGNKSELLAGYFTKNGDGGVDFLPIGGLYKTQVRELAKFLGIPEEIIEAVPSAGLWEGQTDEDELGLAYAELDRVLYCLHDLKLSGREAGVRAGVEASKVGRVLSLMASGSHKLSTPPSCVLDGLPPLV